MWYNKLIYVTEQTTRTRNTEEIQNFTDVFGVLLTIEVLLIQYDHFIHDYQGH